MDDSYFLEISSNERFSIEFVVTWDFLSTFIFFEFFFSCQFLLRQGRFFQDFFYFLLKAFPMKFAEVLFRVECM